MIDVATAEDNIIEGKGYQTLDDSELYSFYLGINEENLTKLIQHANIQQERDILYNMHCLGAAIMPEVFHIHSCLVTFVGQVACACAVCAVTTY